MENKISLTKNKLTSNMIIQGICFAMYFFAFQLTEFKINDRSNELIGADSVIYVYSLGILFTAFGFLSFALVHKLFRSSKIQKSEQCIISVIAVISTISVLISGNEVVFILSAMIALLSFGNIGGLVYYSCAMTLLHSHFTGRLIGISMGTAVLLQYIVQNILMSSTTYIVSIMISVAILMYLAIHSSKEWMFDGSLPDLNRKDVKSKRVLIIAVILMSIICALLDGVVMPAHAQGKTSVSDYVRLFYVASLICSGFIADMNERKFLSLFTVCFMFLSTISSAFFSSTVTYWLGTAFIYIFSGFYVIFLTVSFIDLAQKSKNPTLWAGMGRTIRSLTVAATTIPTAFCYKNFGNATLVITSCIFSLITFLVLIKDISIIFVQQQKQESDVKQNATLLTRDEKMMVYSEIYRLTPRETEVVEKLLASDEGVQEIADKLFISRRMLQRYIADIYRKTSTKSRIGLFQSFNDFCIK